MKIVLDTNVLLVSVSSRSESHTIFLSLIQGDYSIAVTTDILLEYEEIIAQHMGKEVAENTLKALVRSPFVNKTHVHFFWQLISKDPDDNKFPDCAIAANVDYLVTEDKDFNVLKSINFPKLTILSKSQFLVVLQDTIS